MKTKFRTVQGHSPKRIFAAATNNDHLELMIYDTIGESWFGGGVTAEAVKQKLDEAGNVSKISVRINSPGGDAFEGAAIYSLLSQHKATVECYIDGLAASAAFTIAMAGKKVHISEAAMMMCHNSWGMCIGAAVEMTKTADILAKLDGTMSNVYSSHAGMTVDEAKALMDEETWMTAEEAVEYGFADDVIKRDPEEEDDAQTLAASFDLSKFKKAPKAEQEPPKDEAAPPPASAAPADNECMCACDACEAEDCMNCSNEDCEDPNCEGCPNQASAAAAALAAIAEVDRAREEFSILSI